MFVFNLVRKLEINAIFIMIYDPVANFETHPLVRMKSFQRFLKNIHSAAHMNGLLVFIEMKQKKYQNGWLKKSFSIATKSWTIHQFEWIWTKLCGITHVTLKLYVLIIKGKRNELRAFFSNLGASWRYIPIHSNLDESERNFVALSM